jgi:hypothetical protein
MLLMTLTITCWLPLVSFQGSVTGSRDPRSWIISQLNLIGAASVIDSRENNFAQLERRQIGGKKIELKSKENVSRNMTGEIIVAVGKVGQ